LRTPFRVLHPRSSNGKKKGSSPLRVGTPIPRDLESHASGPRRYFLAFFAPFLGAAFFAGFFAAGFLAAFFFAVAMVPTSSLLWVAGGLGISRPFMPFRLYKDHKEPMVETLNILRFVLFTHTRCSMSRKKCTFSLSLVFFFFGSSKFGLPPGRKPGWGDRLETGAMSCLSEIQAVGGRECLKPEKRSPKPGGFFPVRRQPNAKASGNRVCEFRNSLRPSGHPHTPRK